MFNYIKNKALLNIYAGAGGVDAQDWASMLFRMYQRYAQKKGWSFSVLNQSFGEQKGLKSASVEIKGDDVYELLKRESGVHRLVRISPFDANKRRHTSFASVDVIAEVEADIDIEIRPEDISVDVFRAGGKGGQHVNKTESAVRITHIPTGIIVQCQSERSQFKNKSTALKILKARLYKSEEAKRISESQSAYDSKKEISWGSQIRSYVLHPYSMVKDHRTDHETSNAQAVLDGELDAFMKTFLKWNKK